jgi:dihydroflavonol-4-reductase
VRKDSNRRNLADVPHEAMEGDLTNEASLARAVAGCRYLVHVAADYRIWVPDPRAMEAANVAGTVTLMRLAQAAGVERVVHCSSVAALGLMPDGSPADEATPTSEATIIGAYKRSKYRSEQAVLALVREHGLPAVIVNPSGPVGPRDIKPTPTGRMVLDAAAGRLPAYVDTGLNIVHVDDVGLGHVLALERGRIGERYILGGENLTLQALLGLIADVAARRPPMLGLPITPLWPVAVAAEAVARLTGIVPPVTRDHLRMARKHMYFSSAKAIAELGYAPRPVRAGIVAALDWFRANGMLRT